MLELVVLLILGLVFVALFLFWVLGLWGVEFEFPPSQVARLTELVPLAAASHTRAERLFDARDYRFLTSHPRLRQAAHQLERDRRQTALVWLKLVGEDFGRLQQFRRTLVAFGAKTDLRTEWRLLTHAVSFHALRHLLAFWIRFFGLYAAPRAHTALLASVRRLSTNLASVLAHLSPSQLRELKQTWQAQAPSPSSDR